VGSYSGAIDGSVGPTSTAAIKAFQAPTGITVDGIYGPNTQGHLLTADKAGTKVCSSSTPVTTTTTTTVPSTTTTSGSSVSAPRTTTALGAALPSGDVLGNIQCGQEWAAGSATNTMYTHAFLLQSSNRVWVQPPSNACANAASLGIPSAVLAESPCEVS
jgi:Putative peptidoglycan binding domain